METDLSNHTLDLDILLNYPFLKKEVTKTGWSYKGFIEVMGKDFEVTIQSRDLHHVSVKSNSPISNLEKICNSPENKNPLIFLENLSTLLKSQVPNQEITNNNNIYRRVLSEYSELIQFHLKIQTATLSPDLGEIQICTLDEKGRQHKLIIGVKYGCVDDNIFTIKSFDLPEFRDKYNFMDDSSLISLYDKFSAELDNPSMQEFFDYMEELDRNTWVLDPVEPSYKDTFRRVSLGENLSAVLQYNSLDLKNMPNIRFLGPKNLVAPFEERLNEFYVHWDASEGPMSGLLDMLGLEEFPQKKKEESDDFLLVNTGECCICFQMRFDNHLPEITCPNPCCSQIFHKHCLYQWLSSLNPRRVHYEICDKCPNCQKLIHCPVPMESE